MSSDVEIGALHPVHWASRVRESPKLFPVGVSGTILFILIFITTGIIDQSPLLPGGNWQPLLPEFELYLFLDLGAMLLILHLPADRIREMEFGDFGQFLVWFAAFGFATWVVMTLLYQVDQAPSELPSAQQIQQLIAILFAVAPVEEFVFRMVLPALILPSKTADGRPGVMGGWIVSSCVLFAAFHVWAYSLSGATGIGLVSQLFWPGVLGVVLWYARKYFGWGGSMGIHFGWDVVTTGVSGLLPFGIIHALGIGPI